MEIKKLVESLHRLERIVVPTLAEHKELKQIITASGLKEVEVMRALQWLENKNVLKLHSGYKEMVSLDVNGKKYLKEGLPESRLLKALKKKSLTMEQAIKTAKLGKAELNVSIGTLKSKTALKFQAGKISITPHGRKMLSTDTLEEKFLAKLGKGDIDIKTLADEEWFACDKFKKRKDIIKTTLVNKREIELTDLGKSLVKTKMSSKDMIEQLTPQLIKSGAWKGKPFRRYDVKINVPKITGGKRHFEKDAINYIKRIWLDLGFKEMNGSLIQTSFWDLDSLFVPQDHPARQMQDTFFIKDPKSGTLPKDLARKVKAVHENGGDTGSLGWQSAWSEEKARENLLRTHTTVLSARTISALKESDLPAKFFAIGKVFRNETLDWKHLFEFYQVEGIVVDPDANMKHLKGYLKEFYAKMGFDDIRMRPAHFPYTEPSIEVDVLHPVRNEWVELGGAGIFRPEVVVPLLGEDIPVLAWGQGMARIISDYFSITDIRDVNKNNLKQIRGMKAFMM